MKTKTLYWILGAWLTFLLVMALTGCKTKSVIEVVQVHDTLRVSKTDTLTLYQGREVHDTLTQTVERVVTLRESGDTLRVTVYKDRYRNIYVHDTIDRYKAKYDSLLSVKTDTHTREVIKQPSWWQRWGVFIAVMAVCLVITLSIKNKG